MFEIRKINCTIKPEKFESLNNGIWYYNFNIDSEVVTTSSIGEDDFKEITRYKYSQVRVIGLPTVNKCYEAVLKAYVDKDNTTLFDALNSPMKTSELEELADSLYEMIEIDLGLKKQPTELEIEKKKAIKSIDDYDVSPEINSFFLNGLQVWLDKSTRVGLMNSLNIERAAGKEISTLWFGNLKLDINIEAAIQMLSALELYALKCYNKTAEHKVNVNNLTSVDEIINYNYTEGYPEKLKFNV